MAALKAVLPNLDDVDEAIKGFYVEKDGKFYLDLESIEEHTANRALASSLQALRAERQKLKSDLAAMKETLAKYPEDFNPEEYEELKTKLAELDDDDDEGDDDDKKKRRRDDDNKRVLSLTRQFEQKIERQKKQYEQMLKEEREDKAAIEASLRRVLIEEGLTKHLVDAGVSSPFLPGAIALLRSNAVVEIEDGEHRAMIKTDAGNVPLEKFVPDWAASDDGKPYVAQAKGGDANGSGARRRSETTEANPWKDGPTFNLTQQGLIMKQDRAKAERLAKAAGKALPPQLS